MMDRREAAHRALDRAIDSEIDRLIQIIVDLLAEVVDDGERSKGIIIGMQRSIRILKDYQ